MSSSAAAADLDSQLAALDQMELEPLRSEWRRLYRAAPPGRLSHDLLTRGVAYKLQEAAHGGLRATTRRKLAALLDVRAGDKPDRTAPAITLHPGAMLVRTWGGRTHTVQVLADGYEHQGQRYRSLSHIARTITGAHWSGPRFFGLTSKTAAGSDAQASS